MVKWRVRHAATERTRRRVAQGIESPRLDLFKKREPVACQPAASVDRTGIHGSLKISNVCLLLRGNIFGCALPAKHLAAKACWPACSCA